MRETAGGTDVSPGINACVVLPLDSYFATGITLILNTIVFIGYVLATELGLGYKTAMSLFLSPDVLRSPVVNRRWTLHQGSRLAGALLRHVKVYLKGYLANLAGLVLFVDTAGLPHLVVQAVLIVLISILLFMLQKYWGFPLVQPLVSLDSGT